MGKWVANWESVPVRPIPAVERGFGVCGVVAAVRVGRFRARTPGGWPGTFHGLMGESNLGPAAANSGGGIEAVYPSRFSLNSTPSRSGGEDSIESLRERLRALERENAALREKLSAIAHAVGASDSEKIVHDVRNLLNELVLLRKLAELEE
jgi:hypothetical protein